MTACVAVVIIMWAVRVPAAVTGGLSSRKSAGLDQIKGITKLFADHEEFGIRGWIRGVIIARLVQIPRIFCEGFHEVVIRNIIDAVEPITTNYKVGHPSMKMSVVKCLSWMHLGNISVFRS